MNDKNIKCSVCGSGPAINGVSVFLNGQNDMDPPEWRCEVHIDPEFRDQKQLMIAAIIEARSHTFH